MSLTGTAERWLPALLDAMRAENDASDNTVMAYHHDISLFIAFMGARPAAAAPPTSHRVAR